MPNLALCNYALPGGRIYRQPRLRDQTHCRFHICNQHEASMDRLYDQLTAWTCPSFSKPSAASLKTSSASCAATPKPGSRSRSHGTVSMIAGT